MAGILFEPSGHLESCRQQGARGRAIVTHLSGTADPSLVKINHNSALSQEPQRLPQRLQDDVVRGAGPGLWDLRGRKQGTFYIQSKCLDAIFLLACVARLRVSALSKISEVASLSLSARPALASRSTLSIRAMRYCASTCDIGIGRLSVRKMGEVCAMSNISPCGAIWRAAIQELDSS